MANQGTNAAGRNSLEIANSARGQGNPNLNQRCAVKDANRKIGKKAAGAQIASQEENLSSPEVVVDQQWLANEGTAR